MRKLLAMILVASGLSFFSPFSASAMPASGAAIERSVGAESPVEQAYYYRRYHYYRPYHRHYYRPHYHYYRPYYRPYHYYRPYYHRRHYW